MVPASSSSREVGLRDRKKAETRRALSEAAQLSFAAGGPTLERMCADVGVSKRTFFRYFSGREDAAMMPLQDQWNAFRVILDERLHDVRSGVSVFAVVQEAFAEATRVCAERDPDWIITMRRALVLETEHASIVAHNLGFSATLTPAIAAAIAAHAGAPTLRARLLFEVFVVAVRAAQHSWLNAPRGSENVEVLLDQLDRAVATLAPSLGLRVRVAR
ncbi:AcrR family transcriptional regulator [Mycetocola sp. BIGb0189]|uniref:TetR/AcrR family transcriptional regulator n=1 Tax=Mycetocola sp. BIGb0189 TaxID=2940604 RepID=UPI002169BAE0|nr:hypothetical protein [Mycetocola sp. BIGb0189]MCS4275206.1 AcrR family transcriptional regulator [Mycetocola sp. BIGb0189]